MSRLPLVSPLERALFLKGQGYLEGLHSGVIAVLASYSEEFFYTAGEEIRAPGAPIGRVMFLARGEVEIFGGEEVGTRRRNRDARVEAPGAVGLAHHFAGTRHPPGVRALSDTLCLEIATGDLDQILEDHFSLFMQFARTNADELGRAREALGKGRPDECGYRQVDHCETPVEMDLVQLLSQVRRAPFFRGTNLNVLAELIRGQKPERIAAGACVAEAGDVADQLIFVLDGQLVSRGDFGSIGAGSGATLGAWEIVRSGGYFESWFAVSPCRILSIPRRLFADLLEDHFDFALSFLGQMSGKLVDTWDQIALLEESGGDEPGQHSEKRGF